MNRQWLIGILSCICVFACIPSEFESKEPFFLQGGERIVFFGDSITQGGLYVEYIEAFLVTRFPDRQFDIINRGISSETLSGTSEIEHNPPRPDAHKRFSRDITPLKPDVLVSCFGMNDGNYHPFSEELFAKYRSGVERLIKRASEQANTTLVIMTPPPFDPYRKKISNPNAKQWSYKYPFIGYDNVLEHYSQWLLTFRKDGFIVADVHTALNNHLAKRRKETVSFYLSGDGVHPNPTGHWLMAKTLLLAWNAPTEAGSAGIDANTKTSFLGDVSSLKVQSGTVEFNWRTSLPMPMDPRWDAESVALEKSAERLNRHRLKVTKLEPGRYRLFANNEMITELGNDALEKGIDLLALPEFPTVKQSQKVLKLVQQRQQLLYKAWRNSIKAGDNNLPESITEEAEKLNAGIRQLCRPVSIVLRISPVPD